MMHEPIPRRTEERKQNRKDCAELQRDPAGLAPFAFTTFGTHLDFLLFVAAR